MATNTMMPYSNRSGANGTSSAPGGMPKPTAMAVPGGPGANSTMNPYTPPGTAPTASVPSSPTTPGQAGSNSPLVTTSTDGNQNALQKQLIDIYGQGVGTELMTLLNGMGGTNSAAFQQYLQSMAPVEASEKAGLATSLGNMGVSGNSTVMANSMADLNAQFNAQASGVDSQMMMQQLQDTIGIVSGTQQSAQQEVASSGWDVFGQVMGDIGGLAGDTIGAAGKAGGFTSLFS